MRTYKVRIAPMSAFGTPLKGDSLFGHFCWLVRNVHGEDRLASLLDGYTAGRPFAVISDAMPAGHLPRPVLPGSMFDEVNADRKTVKKRSWLPEEHFHKPVKTWLSHARTTSEIPGAAPVEQSQPHNTLNRLTGTTGKKEFAPYVMPQIWYGHRKSDGAINAAQVFLDIYIVLDEERLRFEDFRTLLTTLGKTGFGRDASIGLGKFDVISLAPYDLPTHDGANAWLTLAPCAPQGLAWDSDRCYYQIFTRFGRHGDLGALSKNPFKTPVLLADIGSVLKPSRFENKMFIGEGLGGDGTLSKSIHSTVHQGYAPVVSIKLPE